jgi:hypothetical protein
MQIQAAAPTGRVSIACRVLGDRLLRVVHVQSLLSVTGAATKVHHEVFEEIASTLESRKVDAILWIDRLDAFRVEQLDRDVRFC